MISVLGRYFSVTCQIVSKLDGKFGDENFIIPADTDIDPKKGLHFYMMTVYGKMYG